METPEFIRDLVEKEINGIPDRILVERIRELLVSPYCVYRAWGYGSPGLTYPCWTILEHRSSDTGIAYCSQGFGPTEPWGLVSLSGPDMNIGMDSGWYARLEDAMRNSVAWQGGNPPGYEIP